MTIDRSLRVRKGMLSNRNVLKRAERLEKLKETERWQEGDSVFGLPKVHRESCTEKEEEGQEGRRRNRRNRRYS